MKDRIETTEHGLKSYGGWFRYYRQHDLSEQEAHEKALKWIVANKLATVSADSDLYHALGGPPACCLLYTSPSPRDS